MCAGALLPSGARTNLRAVALRARRPWKLYGNVADPLWLAAAAPWARSQLKLLRVVADHRTFESFAGLGFEIVDVIYPDRAKPVPVRPRDEIAVDGRSEAKTVCAPALRLALVL